MGGDRNSVHLVTAAGVEVVADPDPRIEVARALVARIAAALAEPAR